MADTVSSIVLLNGPSRYVVKFLNKSDGTGESAVTKINISTLKNVAGIAPASLIIEKVEYSITGMTVQILSNGTTPKVLFNIGPTGSNTLDYRDSAGINTVNAGTNGGNVMFTTIGAASNNTYDITLFCRLN